MGLSWKNPGAVVPAVLLVGAIAFGVAAWGYGLGSGTAPGPGLFPFVVAVAVVLSSIGWLVTTAREPAHLQDHPVLVGPCHDHPDLASSAAVAEEAGPEDPDESLDWRRIGGVALAAVLVIPLSTWIGLVAASGVLAAVTARLMRVRPWLALLLGVVFTAAAYLLFDMWLDVPLPDGFLLTQGVRT